MHMFEIFFYIIPLDTSVKFYLIDLFLNQKYVVGTQKKLLNAILRSVLVASPDKLKPPQSKSYSNALAYVMRRLIG